MTSQELLGQELGTSAWIVVDQPRIDAFADCTGDHQWIHVDPVRAAQGPFGTTIAHGYLTLSLVAATITEVIAGKLRAGAFLNYGLDRLRFVAPVPVGSRVRNRVTLSAAEPKGGGRTLYTFGCTLEIEGVDKPALVADVLAMGVGDA